MKNNLYPEGEDFSLYEVEKENKYDETDRNSYLFDFKKGDFVKNSDGTFIRCSPSKAHEQWCQKVMLTPRFKKLAYPDYIGHEYGELINSNLSKSAIELELQRMTIEALMVHPKTLNVGNFIFNWIEDGIMFVYEVENTDKERFKIGNKIRY